MTSFAWAIIAVFALNALAAFLAGYVIGEAVARKRALRFGNKTKVSGNGFTQEMQKQMDEAHAEDEDD